MCLLIHRFPLLFFFEIYILKKKMFFWQILPQSQIYSITHNFTCCSATCISYNLETRPRDTIRPGFGFQQESFVRNSTFLQEHVTSAFLLCSLWQQHHSLCSTGVFITVIVISLISCNSPLKRNSFPCHCLYTVYIGKSIYLFQSLFSSSFPSLFQI